MERAVLALLLTISTATWAAEDHRNIYDVFHQWIKPLSEATVDEQGTALIKRYMASLLYPVDMASFERPETDKRFRDAIMMLQAQMGTATTGNLTSDEFDRLAQAARDIEEYPVGLQPGTLVDVAKDASWVAASGTLAGGDVTRKINHTRINCIRAEEICHVFSASFDPNTSFLWLNLGPVAYKIEVWTQDTIMAVNKHACGVDTMKIDIPTKTVTIESTGSCVNKARSTYSLTDGGEVARQLHRERVNKAQPLVYKPARRLLPIGPERPPSPAENQSAPDATR